MGQLTPSNFIAVAAATAALCCSIVPPFSRTLILFLFAIGHPEALWRNVNKEERKSKGKKVRREVVKIFIQDSEEIYEIPTAANCGALSPFLSQQLNLTASFTFF